MNIRTIGLAALLTAAASSLTAQITHQHVASAVGVNGEGEIVAYDAGSGNFFVTNPDTDSLDVFSYSAGVLTLHSSIALTGAPNSCDVYNGLVAVAVEGATKQDLGQVQFFDAASFAQSPSVTVGALPDMLAFTPDGSKIVVANEGEADEVSGFNNPIGSVSIVDVATRTVAHATFAAFESQKAALQAAGVRIQDANGISLSQDMEPEYVAISADGTTAYVACQENNAFAIVDIASASVTSILPLGEKDHSLPGNAFDASNDDNIDGNFQNWPVKGYYMPDGICTFTVNGVEYIASANEGDGRDDFPGFEDETRGDDLEGDFVMDTEDPTPDTGLYTSAQLNDDALLGRLKMVTSPYDIARGDTDGDGDVDQLYSFGARSVTIWDTAGNVVFDSGDVLEQAMLANGLWQEGRSDDKGPEPEAVVFGEVDGVPCLFVGLERTNAVCVFDVTDPANAALVDVIDIPGESGLSAFGPEGLKFLSASSSPLGVATLAVTSEVGGVLSLFAVGRGLSDLGQVSLIGSGCEGLTLSSTPASLGASWNLMLEQVNGANAMFFFGDSVVGGLDLGVYGAPGCSLFTNGNLGGFFSNAAGGVSLYSLQVPASAALAGCALTVQGSGPSNALSFATSNGVRVTFAN